MRLSLAIKLVSLASLVFIISGAFCLALIGLSSRQIGITPGNPVTELTGSVARITLPVKISNKVFLPIKSFTLLSTVSDGSLEKLVETKVGPLEIPPQGTRDIPLTMEFSFNTLKLEALKRLAFNNENFTLNIQGSLSLEPLVTLGISVQTILPWGAPLYNFSVGQPALTLYNGTVVLASLPVNFKNNSPFLHLDAGISAEFYDSTGVLVGSGDPVVVSVPAKTFYQGIIGGLVKTSAAGGTTRVKLTFTTIYGTFTREVILDA